MPLMQFGSRRVSGEIPQQGFDPNHGYDLGFALISGTTNSYELRRQKSASFTLSEHGSNAVGKIDTLISVQTAFVIRENANGAVTIG